MCEDCAGGRNGPHEPWCPIDAPRPHRAPPRPPCGARCFICRQRAFDCDCPDGPDID